MLRCNFFRKRLDYVNHARRLAEGDWTEKEEEKIDDTQEKEDGVGGEEEEMDVDAGKKLPRHYANQVIYM